MGKQLVHKNKENIKSHFEGVLHLRDFTIHLLHTGTRARLIIMMNTNNRGLPL